MDTIYSESFHISTIYVLIHTSAFILKLFHATRKYIFIISTNILNIYKYTYSCFIQYIHKPTQQNGVIIYIFTIVIPIKFYFHRLFFWNFWVYIKCPTSQAYLISYLLNLCLIPIFISIAKYHFYNMIKNIYNYT